MGVKENLELKSSTVLFWKLIFLGPDQDSNFITEPRLGKIGIKTNNSEKMSIEYSSSFFSDNWYHVHRKNQFLAFLFLRVVVSDI